jgi:drug/metabolite transporter (DMT)-like permease
LWTLLCAITWAIYIARLEDFSVALPSRELTAASLWVVVIFGLGWTAFSHPAHGPIPWLAIVYLGLFATAITTWLQTLGQKWVSAPQAAVLYTLEPVWAALFSWRFHCGILGTAGLCGGATILAAAMLTQWPAKRAKPIAVESPISAPIPSPGLRRVQSSRTPGEG